MINWDLDVFPQGIYIHWPFCKNKCHYCDFVSFAKHEGFEGQYHEALLGEIKAFAAQDFRFSGRAVEVQTIFLGGGSPSLYPLDLLKELIDALRKNFDLSVLKEFTIECNPADVTEEKLKCWKNLGINRLSIGVQVLNSKILQNLNRRQKNEDVLNVMRIAPKYFDNISVDLILGLPCVTNAVWNETLKTIALLPINHVSIYFLTVYEKTPLYFSLKKGEIVLPGEDETVLLYEKTVEFLKEHDFDQYEISNFAKSGFESVHNIGYWDFKPYKGFGLSASSFDGKSRFMNYKNLTKYLSKAPLGECFECEVLSEDQKIMEFLMLSLRQRKGVGLRRVLYLLKDSSKNRFLEKIKCLKSEGLVRVVDDRIQLTLKGMFLENEVILDLLS